jgi:hypothetical protein
MFFSVFCKSWSSFVPQSSTVGWSICPSSHARTKTIPLVHADGDSVCTTSTKIQDSTSKTAFPEVKIIALSIIGTEKDCCVGWRPLEDEGKPESIATSNL